MTPEARKAHLARRRELRKPLTELQRAEAKIRMLKWRERQIADGKCVSCTAVATHGLVCEGHFFRRVAANHRLLPLGAGSILLRQLWSAQGGRCAITGETLRPGINASLDHKVAIAKGGTNSGENIHWVLYSVNATKADLSLAEFVAMCRKVVSHADSKVTMLRKVEDK